MVPSEKTIPTWTMIREAIDNIDNNETRNILRASYLFGTSISELIRGRTQKETITGNDFFTKSIEGEEALFLKISTARRGYKPRYVAVPLNPKYEKWSKILLEYSEEKADKRLYKNTDRSLQQNIKKIYFKKYEWPSPGYKEKKDKSRDRTSFTHKHLSETREWELGLCHNFNEYEFKHFFGDFYDSEPNTYFKKLLNKSDFYDNKDVVESIELKNVIFTPDRNRHLYKIFIDIQKMIKRKYIEKQKPIKIPININIDHKFLKKKVGKEHKILQANVKDYLEREKKSKKVFCERSNLDVVDYSRGIVIECGHTEAGKLFDVFNAVFPEIQNITAFWVLQFYDKEERISSCYKFNKLINYPKF